jgi:hypothetical protein
MGYDSGSHHDTTMAPTPAGSALAVSGAANTSLSLQITSPDDLQRLARLFAASGLFGRSGNSEALMAECAIKILAGMEAGFGPFASAGGVTVINGKPGFGANLLAQAIKRHPLYDYRVLEKTDKVCRIKFLAGKEELGVETFSMEMAKRAGLTKDGGMYSKYPEALLFARALSAGMRTHCPDALGGAPAYTPEELGAQGEIDENGMVAVTVVEESSDRDQLQAQAIRRLKDAGLTAAGTRAMLAELGEPGATGMGQLSDKVLGRLANAGASAETIARWNASTPAAPANVGIIVRDFFNPEAEEEVDLDLAPEDPDDDEPPAAWAAPAA